MGKMIHVFVLPHEPWPLDVFLTTGSEPGPNTVDCTVASERMLSTGKIWHCGFIGSTTGTAKMGCNDCL
jgi:hypothetical protein